MADTEIKNLTAATAAAATNIIPIDEAGTTKALTVAQVQQYVVSVTMGIIEASRQGMNLP